MLFKTHLLFVVAATATVATSVYGQESGLVLTETEERGGDMGMDARNLGQPDMMEEFICSCEMCRCSEGIGPPFKPTGGKLSKKKSSKKKSSKKNGGGGNAGGGNAVNFLEVFQTDGGNLMQSEGTCCERCCLNVLTFFLVSLDP